MRPSCDFGQRAVVSVPAVQYVRMSTDLQKYSIENQKQAIAEFATARGILIVDTYEDAGRSGVTMRNRPALSRLLSNVQKPSRNFDLVLVYDVSRWGRFLDVDESAHYEFLCRQAGVDVIYCGENFVNDGSSVSNIIKTVKRAMAGEYSCELSRKVYAGQRSGAERGFWQGSSPGYGLRRILVDADRRVKGPLQHSERKSIQSDRVVIVPGPPNEVALVRRIYRWYAYDGWSPVLIARRLNEFGLFNDRGRPWRADSVSQMLQNEKYAGTNVYGRTSEKLGSRWSTNRPAEWVRAIGAFEPVIDRETFEIAQARRTNRTCHIPDDEMLERLTRFAARTANVNIRTINADPEMPSGETYQRRFGSILTAYRRVGYVPRSQDDFAAQYHAAGKLLDDCTTTTLAALQADGHQIECSPDGTLVRVDGALLIKFCVRVIHHYRDRGKFWRIRWPARCSPDFMVVGRLDSDTMAGEDVYVFPVGVLPRDRDIDLPYRRHRHELLDAFRFPDTAVLQELCVRCPLEDIHGRHPPKERERDPA